MIKAHLSGKPFDDTERIREDVETLLTLSFLRRGLVLPDCIGLDDGSARANPSNGVRPPPAAERDISDLRERVLIEIDRRYGSAEAGGRNRMAFYKDHLLRVADLGPMLDIGCGRGMFLELMRDIGARPIGIDQSKRQVDFCRANGFDAYTIDAYEFLKAQADNQYSAVSMLHVVEHLQFDDLLRVLSEIHRVLAVGGIVLIETPNPENLFVSSVIFHIDPTHVRPVPFQFISTVLSVIGFEVERLPLHIPIHDEPGNLTENIHLNNSLTASAALSLLGRKPA